MSAKAEFLTGYSAKDLVGRSFLGLLTPETAKQGEVRLAAIRRGEPVPPLVEFEFKRHDGTTLWVEANITSASSRTDRRRVVGRLVVAREITERKSTEAEHRQLFEKVRESQDRLRAVSRRLIEVQEDERRHIARELHDEIGQVLTGLRLSLERAMRLPAEEIKDTLDRMLRLVNELMGKVREMSLDLRPSMLDDLGLLPALAWLFERYSALTNVRVKFEHARIEHRFDQKIETAVFRIVQEALTNVARHAGVRKATVHLWTNRDGLYVQVQDQGVGFEPAAAQAPGHGSGLIGMHERVRLLGGHLAVESAPGKGALVTARFPWTGRTRTSQTTDRTET